MDSKVIAYIVLVLSIRFLLITAAKCPVGWKSLNQQREPTWYEDAKVGIMIHWGVYSVPSFGSEWFWSNWMNKEKDYVDFMEKNYKPNFTYQDFAKEFTAELFNATQSANLFSESGARYVVLTGKHCDGFTLWPSKESNSWNALDVGPKRDLVRELSDAVRKQNNLKFGVYYSMEEWFNRMYIDDQKHNFKQRNYPERKVRPELTDLVNNYLPDILWIPYHEKPSNYWKSEEFIDWLYNESPVRDTVVTTRHLAANGFHASAVDSNTYALQKEKWENFFKLDKQSWGHRFDTTLSDYLSSEQVIANIVKTVSCNGNALINIGPTKYGTISPIFEERLHDMGHWLKMNGEAIYGSKYWDYQEDPITDNVWYTAKSLNSKEMYVYAIILDYPETNEIKLQPFDEFDLSSELMLSSIKLLGMEDTPINWTNDNDIVKIQMPPKQLIDKRKLKFAWTLKMQLKEY